jgi:site-specific recombinase XerD
MSIIINGERTYITLGRKERAEEFSKLITSKRQNELKVYLSDVYQKTQSKVAEMMTQNIPLTAFNLKEYIQNGCCNSYTIEQMFSDYLALAKKKIGNGLTLGVYKKYELVRDRFFEHINKQRQVTEITNAVISGFYADLTSKYEDSTSGGMMTRLKTVVKFAISNGKLQKDPFAEIKINKGEKEVEFLTETELKVIRLKKLHNERLEKVRDLFLFQCFTGLAYVDLAELTKEDYQKNELGQIFIRKRRSKTGVPFTTILLEDAIKIAEKYDYELPVLSNQKYNSYLKEIADLCNIKKPLHTHIGRHTCGTYLLNKGLSLEVVAKILGHSNTKQTKHYAKLLDNSVFNAVASI